MNNENKKNNQQVNINKFSEEKTIIIKSGSMLKRSKYLKLWKNEDKNADCTMNLDIKDCKKVENSDNQLSKNNTFAMSEVEKYEWINALKKVITNPGVINEQEEIDYANNPDRTISFISSDK